MKTKTKPGTLDWLKANALFGCGTQGCSEEYSWAASELAWMPDGENLVCELCYDEVGYSQVKESEDAEPTAWGELREFKPFACVEPSSFRNGQETMLEEVKALRDKHRGIWGIFSTALDALTLQEPTEQAK